MDYKGQIEALKNLEAIAYGYNINGEVLGMDCSDFEQIMVDAADSITGLLARAEAAEAENTALRAEAERWRNAHHQAALNFQQENRECNKALSELEQIKAENAALRKMQPVQLDDASAQTMELAAVVSELRLKVSDLQRETERQRKTAENWRECWDRELGLRKAAEARAEKAEKVLSATYRTIYALASDCTPEVCKELCANHDGVCSKHAEAGHYDRCKGFKWIGEKEAQNSNDTNADTAAPDPVC